MNIEYIPDCDMLYRWIHKNALIKIPVDQHGIAIEPSMFMLKDGEDGMSVLWEKYSTAEEARTRAPKPSANGIIGFMAGDVRGDGHEVKHDPQPCNKAHSLVLYKNKSELRTTLAKVSCWIIPV